MSKTRCPRRRWGKTDLSIPVITLGGDGFGNKFAPVTDDEAFALVRRAVDLGVNHFDLSRCYGDSLQKVGRAIKQGVIQRKEVILNGRICCHGSGQWGRTRPNDPKYSAEVADYTAGRVIPDLRDQLEILGTDRFDAVLVHDPWPVAPSLAPGGLLEGLEQAKSQGLVNFIGYGMHYLPFHLEALDSNRVDILLTYAEYNLLHQGAAETIFPTATQKDVGILNAWAIKEGLLTGRPVESIKPKSEWKPAHHRSETIRLWCKDHNIHLLTLALQFCLRNPHIHGLPIGCKNIVELEQNVAAVLTSLPDEVYDSFYQANL